MRKKEDFRPYVSRSHPKAAEVLDGRDHYQHAAAALDNPIARDQIIKPWNEMYAAPFVGLTSDGQAIPGLYSLAPNGAPTEAMVAAMLRLLPMLSAEQRNAIGFPVDAREWRRWNNTEMYLYPQGLRLEEVTVEVREAILDVVRESLSARGFAKTRDVMRFNQALGELIGNTKVLNEWSYNFSLFGTPSPTEPWGWQLMGHHLALNCLVIGAQLVMSPTFMGAEPCYIDDGLHAGLSLFEDEEHRGLALLRALSDAQRKEAIVYHSMMGGDLPPDRRQRPDQLQLGGAFQDNRVIPYEGVAVQGFTREQRRRLLDLIESYVDPMPDGPMRARMDEIERHLDGTHFCWIGGTRDIDTFYYRIQSPVVMIEFDQHSGVFLSNKEPAKFHIHTIVRTPNGNDYGADLLRMHYQASHQGSRPGGQDAALRSDHDGGHAGHAQSAGETRRHSHGGYSHSHSHSGAHDRGHSHGHNHAHEHPHSHGSGYGIVNPRRKDKRDSQDGNQSMRADGESAAPAEPQARRSSSAGKSTDKKDGKPT